MDEQLTKIVIEDGMMAVELTEDMAMFIALAFRVKSAGGICQALGGFCQYCPVKNCSYTEAVEYMKEYCK